MATALGSRHISDIMNPIQDKLTHPLNTDDLNELLLEAGNAEADREQRLAA